MPPRVMIRNPATDPAIRTSVQLGGRHGAARSRRRRSKPRAGPMRVHDIYFVSRMSICFLNGGTECRIRDIRSAAGAIRTSAARA